MMLMGLKSIICDRLILFLTVYFAIAVSAQVIDYQKGSLNCDLLKGNIYCFSGDSLSPDNGISIKMLNIKNNDGRRASYLNSQWSTIVANYNNISLENRVSFQAVALSTGTQMLVSGGYNTNRNNSLVDQTLIYDAEKNTWIKGQNYIEESIGSRQIFAASSVYIPFKGVAFFGGQEEHANSNIGSVTLPGTNASIPFIDNGLTRIAGYSQLTIYNPQSNIWSVPSPQSKLPSIHSYYQTSIYDPKSKNVYFFGGYYYDVLSPNFNLNNPSKHSFAYALTFNLLTGNWGTTNLTGAEKPTSRIFHTTTLLTSTGKDVLLYGGSNGVTQSPDFCYTLDLHTREWSRQSIGASGDAILTRSHHAAVLANDNILFIISGSANDSDHLIILDVSFPNSLSLSDTYQNQLDNIPYGDSFVAPEDNSKKTETIALAVSSVLCCLGLFGGILFWYCRRKRARAARLAEEEQNTAQRVQLDQLNVQHHNNTEPPPPYAPPRPNPSQKKVISPSIFGKGNSDLDWSQYNNVKSKYLDDHEEFAPSNEKKRAPPGGYNGGASSSRSEEIVSDADQDKKIMPPYPSDKPNQS